MHYTTSTEPKFAAPDSTVSSDAVPAALVQSALQMTRAAIARWSGSTGQASAPARDLPRVSPQARWVAQAQDGLAAWIAQGGFSRTDEPSLAPLAAPVMHDCAAPPHGVTSGIGACID